MSAGEAQERVVMVVGASSGIGLAVAQQLDASGARLALLARDRGALERVAAELSGEALILPTDIADRAAVAEAVAACVRAHGRIDAVISTAQVMAYGRIEEVPEEVFSRIVDVALHGTVNLVHALFPQFREQGHGTLVVVNSLLGSIAVPYMGAYSTAKWGQLGLVRTLQLEVREDPGVDVCLVSPGAVDTPIYAQAATYAGSRGSAPPPVVSPEAVARAAVRCLDRPRRHVQVGPANHVAMLGFRFMPAVYDVLVGPLVRNIVLRGPSAGPDDGNVMNPVPAGESLRGGWTPAGRLRAAGRGARWRRRG